MRRITDPADLETPEMVGLIYRAVEAMKTPRLRPRSLWLDLLETARTSETGIFVGYDPYPSGICIGILPTCTLQLMPQIVVAYNEGPPQLARQVGERARAWLLENSEPEALCMNFAHDDAVFMRGLGYFGKPERLGSVIRFDLTHERA